jgi:hypothetical protein
MKQLLCAIHEHESIQQAQHKTPPTNEQIQIPINEKKGQANQSKIVVCDTIDLRDYNCTAL